MRKGDKVYMKDDPDVIGIVQSVDNSTVWVEWPGFHGESLPHSISDLQSKRQP